MIRAIVTDCFGVLYNDILKDMLGRHDISDPAILKSCFETAHASDLGNIELHEFFSTLSELTNIPLQTVRKEMSDVSHLNVGFMEILTRLKTTYRIGMVTDVETNLIAPFLANQRVKDLFDEIVISSEVKVTKPQKQIFEIMADRLNIKPTEIIFIDNSEVNTQAAASLGMTPVLYVNNETLNDSLHLLLPSTSTH